MSKLKVMTWNIADAPCFVTSRNHLDSLNLRIPRIIDKIISDFTDIDMILFNEVFLHRNTILNALKDHYPYSCYLGRRFFRLLGSGLLVVSKHPLTNVTRKYFTRLGTWDIFTSKGFIACDITLDDKIITVISTHMQQGLKRWDAWARNGQIRQIAEFVNSQENDPAIIFGGDLNMSKADARSEQYEHLVESAEFREPIYESEHTLSYIVRFLVKNIRKSETLVIQDWVPWSLSDTHPLHIELAV